MQFSVRGFKKDTLLRFKATKDNPLVGLDKKSRDQLGLEVLASIPILNLAGEVASSAKIVSGKAGFIAVTKSLREALGIFRNQSAEAVLSDGGIRISPVKQA